MWYRNHNRVSDFVNSGISLPTSREHYFLRLLENTSEASILAESEVGGGQALSMQFSQYLTLYPKATLS
jgi:hypothetical protein